MSHEVFIERCKDSSPSTASQLAQAIATRYGIATEQISSRLTSGRFRVKANLALPAAKVFVAFLEENGALCTIVENGVVVVSSVGLTDTQNPVDVVMLDQIALNTPPPPPDLPATSNTPDVVMLDQIARNTPGDLPVTSNSPNTPTLDVVMLDQVDLNTPPPSDPSATSDTHTSNTHDPDVVMLDQFTHDQPSTPAIESKPAFASMQLTTLDGVDGNQASNTGSSRGPNGEQDASNFLPPEAASDALVLEIDRPEPKVRQEMDDVVPAVADELAEATQQNALQPEPEKITNPDAPFVARALAYLSDNTRPRFAIGVALAVLLGFVVMSPIASSRESDRYAEPIAELKADYTDAKSQMAWNELDDLRSETIAELQSRRSSIVLTSLLIWLAFAAMFSYIWMRVIRWERWNVPVS